MEPPEKATLAPIGSDVSDPLRNPLANERSLMK
jgi:hypothetical protein